MHLASVAAAALGCACSAYDPFELALDPASPDTWYRPQVVRAVDFMSHDDSRCVRGWFHAAGKQLDGQHDGAVPAASTLGEARDQAVRERWCLLEPAPDIAKQWFACESDYPQPGTAIYCKCQMVVCHHGVVLPMVCRSSGPQGAMDQGWAVYDWSGYCFLGWLSPVCM